MENGRKGIMTNVKHKESDEAKHFAEVLEKTGHTWWGNKTKVGQYRQDYRAELSINYFSPSTEDTILDLGCGIGIFSYRLANANCKIVGIDITKESIDYANEHLKKDNITYIVGSAYSLPFKNDSIDYVTGNAVLHHFDLSQALPEIMRVLKPGGKLAFFEPNMLNPQIYLEKNVRFIGKALENSEDETAFFKNGIKKELLNYDFVSVEVIPIDFMHPIFPGILLSPLKIANFLLERTPCIKEIAGSLFVRGQKQH